MDGLWATYPLILDGFVLTLQLLLASGLLALVLGTLVGIARVSPVGSLRRTAIVWVTVFRNSPLLVLIVLTVYAVPRIVDLRDLPVDPLFPLVALAMGLYTSAFVAEAIRSGINGVGVDQAEAARSIGMPFGTAMTQVILPQAMRIVVPPMASVFIALTKNTSLGAAFGVAEATFRLNGSLRDFPGDRWFLFGGVALGYIVIVEIISFGANRLERRWAVNR